MSKIKKNLTDENRSPMTVRPGKGKLDPQQSYLHNNYLSNVPIGILESGRPSEAHGGHTAIIRYSPDPGRQTTRGDSGSCAERYSARAE